MLARNRHVIAFIILSAISIFFQPACISKDRNSFIFGLLLVGPHNDRGWSQAHLEAGEYVQNKIPDAKMIYIDRVNPADRPGITIMQLVDDMVEKGAELIIANSDDMKDGIREAAVNHPKVHFVHVSGDDVLTGKAPKNLSNVMGRMEYCKMMAGFAAAMTTKTGKIGYLGPLINEETRRLAAACYLGAKYAWEQIRQKADTDLHFQVSWIGFWFNIPGVTADPTQVAQKFYDTDYDVIISGLDTTEAITVALQKHSAGEEVYVCPYEYKKACQIGPEVCLGVPFFNWGPAYLDFVKDSMAGNFKSRWLWLGPDWENMNNMDTSHVGFQDGPALPLSVKQTLHTFIKDLGSNRINLFKGPLQYQDGSTFLKDGEVASDKQIWYMPQLLKGMSGQSSLK